MSRLLALLVCTLIPFVAQAADEENPFKKAKVGDYAKYNTFMKASAGETKTIRTQTVTAANEKEVSLKTTIEYNGKELPNRPEQKINLTKPFDPTAIEGGLGATLKWEKQKDGKEKVKVGDKEYECTWIAYKPVFPPNAPVTLEGELKVWLSKDVPFVVKRTLAARDKNLVLVYSTELFEFGNKK
jgi:hypothetical protein